MAETHNSSELLTTLVGSTASGASWSYTWLTPALVTITILTLVTLASSNTKLPDKTPQLVRGWPLIGVWGFWSRRNAWLREKQAAVGGFFTLFVGQKGIVNMHGQVGRQHFFDSVKLNFDGGYRALSAGLPAPRTKGNPRETWEGGDEDPHAHQERLFRKRLIPMVRPEQLSKSLPLLTHDIRVRLDKFRQRNSGLMDPFVDIYAMVFQLTMRMVAAKEIADDPAWTDKILSFYTMVDAASSPLLIIFPYLPTWGLVKRFYGAFRVYLVINGLIKDRQKNDRKEDDPMQVLMDHGDTPIEIIAHIMGSLFAGVINSGINASWMMLNLAANPDWYQAVWREVNAAADKYDSDKSKSMAERLANVPLEGWESGFPVIDACLKECMRLNVTGAAFRENNTGRDVRIGEHIVPAGFYASYPLADTHLNPDLYPDPTRWEPGRWVNLDGSPATGPGSAADTTKGSIYPFVGWGAGRHPCLGMKFAKLEQNMMIAYFMADFDFELADPSKGMPEPVMNPAGGAVRPKRTTLLRYWEKGMKQTSVA